MPQFQFSREGIEPHYGGGSPGLPAQVNGQSIRHPVVITASALKPTAKQDGGYMELTITAIDGPCKGMEQVDRLNLQNKSADAVRIANQQLAAYLAVMGMYSFNATEELHNKPFMLETKPRSDNPNTFEVAKLFDVNGNEPSKAGAGGQPAGGGQFGGGQGQPNPGGFGQPNPGGQPAADPNQGQPNPGAQPASQPGWGQGGQQPNGQPQAGQWNQGGGQAQPGWGNR